MKLAGNVQAMVHSMMGDTVLKNLFTLYAFEHFEIASYRSAIAMAEEVGEPSIVQTCRQLLQQEEATCAEAGRDDRIGHEGLHGARGRGRDRGGLRGGGVPGAGSSARSTSPALSRRPPSGRLPAQAWARACRSLITASAAGPSAGPS
jgi:hypothetical protein